jgi:hypothetical protein
MTDNAKFIIETTEAPVLKWAVRQVRSGKVKSDAMAMALHPVSPARTLKSIAAGLDDLAKLTLDKLPESLR